MLKLTVKDNTAQMEAQREKLSELRAKVASLEQTLELRAQEKEHQKRQEKTTLVCVPDSQGELENLHKELARREKELAHIKGIARTVVEQRTELERFFHDALAQVKREISASRQRDADEALRAYRSRFSAATAGKRDFPPICTFHKRLQSTTSVHANTAAAQSWYVPSQAPLWRITNLSDLTVSHDHLDLPGSQDSPAWQQGPIMRSDLGGEGTRAQASLC